MAEKGFGVKEINLIGPSGTPTITSPNNLNLNAVNVAISTNVSIGGTLTVSGNVSVGGTLTYEDVTNIDAVGVITAREGIRLPDSKKIELGSAQDLELFHNGSDSYIDDVGTGRLNIRGSEVAIGKVGTTEVMIRAVPDAQVDLYYDGVNRLRTSSSGVTVTGTLSATTFSGSGASLTNLPVTESDIQVAYTVTANGSSAYNFSGNGSPSGDNPDLYLIRGQKYRFINNSGGSHPFEIRGSSGGSAYSTGVTNNGASSGNIDFAPAFNSPAKLFYQCTSHGGMVGNIYLRDAAGGNLNVGVTTFSGAVNISGDLNVSQKIVHTGNTDTLIEFATDTITFDTDGSERLRITSVGNVPQTRIGPQAATDTTSYEIQLSGAANNDAILSLYNPTTNNGEGIQQGFFFKNSNDTVTEFARIGSTAVETTAATAKGDLRFYTMNGTAGLSNASERLRITSDGKVKVGFINNVNPTIAQFEVQSAQLGGTAGNTQEVVRLHSPDVTNTTSYRFTNYRTSNGTSHVTSELRFRRHVDSTDMGYFGLGDQYVSIGYGTAEKLRITSDGYVTKPSQPAFSAKGTEDAFSAQSPLPYDSIDYNNGNHYNTTTYKFTCPVAGYYYVTCHVIPKNYTNGGNNVELYIKNNGGSRFFLDRDIKTSDYSTNNFSVGGSRIISASANDTLWVEFNAISGTPLLEASSHFGIMLMA